MNAHDLYDDGEALRFIAECRRDRDRFPLSPVACHPTTAKDIDMSGIFRMTPEEIDAALLQVAA